MDARVDLPRASQLPVRPQFHRKESSASPYSPCPGPACGRRSGRPLTAASSASLTAFL